MENLLGPARNGSSGARACLTEIGLDMATSLYRELRDYNSMKLLMQSLITTVSVKRLLLVLLVSGHIVSACQPAPPPVHPTPMPPATPLLPQPPVGSSLVGDATPMPAVRPPALPPLPPTPSPPPTPIPLTGFDWKSVAYREYWPTDLSGDLSVGKGGTGIDAGDWGIFLVDVKNGDKRRITEGSHELREVVISGDYIAWSDRSRQIEIPGSTERNRRSRLVVDIFVMNLVTGEQRRITDIPARRHSLSIDGNLLVWQDNRNEIGEHRNHYDIYAYDIEADKEIAVEISPGVQHYPAVSEDRVVWIDEGEESSRLMLYDFSDDETKVIDDSTEPELPPDIHGDYIVWRGHDESGDHGVYLYDLESKERSLIASARLSSVDSPKVSDRHVVWTVGWPCDGRANIMPDDMGVYVHDLEDGEVQRISNYVEPDVWIDGETLMVHEGCHLPGHVYAIFLE